MRCGAVAGKKGWALTGSILAGGEGRENLVLLLGFLDDIANLLDVVLGLLLGRSELLDIVILVQHLRDGVIAECLPLRVNTLSLAFEGLESCDDSVGTLLLLARADAEEGNGLLGLELRGADEGNADDDGEGDDADRGQDLSRGKGSIHVPAHHALERPLLAACENLQEQPR